jgi:short-chain fatty acids transporter
MNFAERFEKLFRFLLPSPFAIALLLSLFSFILFWLYADGTIAERFSDSINYWQMGLWNGPMLVFMVQMMLMLVLGHVLALAPAINKFINTLLSFSEKPANVTAIIGFFTLSLAFINWGLALVFGAVMARKAAEGFSKKGIAFNYGLLGAAGYSGLMVWHGGLSGSAPIKVAEAGHISSMLGDSIKGFPDRIGFEETIFSAMNLSSSLILLVLVPLLLYYLGRKSPRKLEEIETRNDKLIVETHQGAERLDHSKLVGLAAGLFICGIALNTAIRANGLEYLNPNFINLCLLGLGLSMHSNLHYYLKAIDHAIKGVAGILLQFPLYFGIMGLMRDGGLIGELSIFFSNHSTAFSFPLWSFLSAAVINIFVPSGGGQWAIQGPLILTTAQELGIPISKAIMAMAYGDQLTNMLQPFWALPLLGITGLKAKRIVPYTLLIMLLGILIFVSVLTIF